MTGDEVLHMETKTLLLLNIINSGKGLGQSHIIIIEENMGTTLFCNIVTNFESFIEGNNRSS